MHAYILLYMQLCIACSGVFSGNIIKLIAFIPFLGKLSMMFHSGMAPADRSRWPIKRRLLAGRGVICPGLP